MTCEHLERTSALFDGQLSQSEAHEARAHLAECTECAAFERDALQLRTALRENFPPQPTTNHQQPTPWWRRRIAIPIPLVATAAVLLAAVLFVRAPRREVAPSFRDFDAGRAPVVLVRPRSAR